MLRKVLAERLGDVAPVVDDQDLLAVAGVHGESILSERANDGCYELVEIFGS